ncbi:hypothetical protein [Anaerocolumna chitinilytica]|uniref:Uncharacterized protein n=1 Tax=Anaerocolumna chitinilytica TaxID=1727145 RepID=A0A7M3SA92_9FIRM|nr:hypothetical protein [Anaerocolumna chitinilytica]BCK01510.1 hypothetical protein bsdcttw_45500 [Anaerocolumna chitinilytica]
MNRISLKKKLFILLPLLVLIILVGTRVYTVQSKPDDSSNSFDFFTFGKLLGDNSRNNDTSGANSLYAKGKHIQITEKEYNLHVKVYELKHSKDPEKEALQDLLESKVLYYHAVKEGYSVSDSEINDTIKELKDSMKTAANADDMIAFMKGFGSEDNYWVYIRDTMKSSSVTNKYLDDLKAEYAKKTHYTGEDTADFQNKWKNYKADLISEYIKKEKLHYKK